MTDSLRYRIAAVVAGKPTKSVGDAYAIADAVIAELGLRYEYENGRVFYTEKPAACKANGNWKYRVCSDLELYEG